jgi:antitoxin component of MazEF toxin-antitoxin module
MIKIERKVMKTGSSLAVTLLRGWLDGVGLKSGDRVCQVYSSILVITPKKMSSDSLKKELFRLAEFLGR